MSKHTPGPWSVEVDGRLAISIQPIATVVATYDGLIDVNQNQIDLANARLIAAAPELLEALKTMAGFCQTEIDDNPECRYTLHAQREVEKAWAAIAKAEGRGDE